MCCFLLVEVVDLVFCFLTLTILQLLIISLYAFKCYTLSLETRGQTSVFWSCTLFAKHHVHSFDNLEQFFPTSLWCSSDTGTVLVLSNNCCYGSILTTYVYMYPLWIVKRCDYNGIKLCCQILLWTANIKVFLCVFKENLLFWNAHTGLYIFTQNVVNHLMIILFWPACKL